MKVESISPLECNVVPYAAIKVTTCGHIVEHMSMSKVNRLGSSIINLGDYKYCLPSDIDPDTGEIKQVREMQRTDNRAENLNGIAASMKTVRDLINCNISDVTTARWITLTYAENMTDTKRLYNDRKAFWKRVDRWHKKHGLPTPEYISIVEPQGRGAWHLHELWLYPNKAPYLPNDVIRELWQHGFVTVKKLDDIDNIGAYITAAFIQRMKEDPTVIAQMAAMFGAVQPGQQPGGQN